MKTLHGKMDGHYFTILGGLLGLHLYLYLLQEYLMEDL